MKSYSTYDDSVLVSLLVQGEEGAFAELFGRYWEPMITVAFAKLRSHPDAKEVVQEVFFDLWNRRAQLQIAKGFNAYIAGAVKYRVLTHLAKAARRSAVETGGAVSGWDRSTESYLDYQSLREQIEASVSALPEKCQLVYRLSREQGLSIPEIAEALQVSPKTAEAHLTKALKTVRGGLRNSMGVFVLFL